MTTHTGWVLDVYPDEDGCVVWLLSDTGERLAFRHAFPATFYAAGEPYQLRGLWKTLRELPIPVKLSREEKHDLFTGSIPVLVAEAPSPALLARVFHAIKTQHPALTYYNADIPVHIQYAARFGVYPALRYEIEAEGDLIREIAPLESRWLLNPRPIPLRILQLAPDENPHRRAPAAVLVESEGKTHRIPLEPVRPFLVSMAAFLRKTDPDVLLTEYGDTWLLPAILAKNEGLQIDIPLGRDPARGVQRRRARTYHAYGQVIHRGAQIHLYGRLHIDRRNAMMYGDYGLEGILEAARLTAVPIQEAGRRSPGAGITAMQILQALQDDILVPYTKQQAERPKSALELIHADRGGFVYQPTVGLHRDAAEIDFVSMYPALMIRDNISPEISRAEADISPPGLVPRTLVPLLKKRIRLKGKLRELPYWHPLQKIYKARASAQKWLLVTCFGYLGYKNARFGRIESHEAVTESARETLLDAKETAEALGYRILHMYVDGLWVQQDGITEKETKRLCDAIEARTGIPIVPEGIYNWIAFLPSKRDARMSVPNRYFGRFRQSSPHQSVEDLVKVRGIAARRHDTPAIVRELQLRILASLPDDPAELDAHLPAIFGDIRKQIDGIRRRSISPEKLLAAQKLSREISEYKTPSPAARAAMQLQAADVHIRPGQKVQFVYTRTRAKVWAWEEHRGFDIRLLDAGQYVKQIEDASLSVLQPFGVETLSAQLRLKI